MIIPKVGNKRALFIIDVQPKTFSHERAFTVTEEINKFLTLIQYDAYVVAAYYTPEESIQGKQNKWTITKEEAGPTDPTILKTLAGKQNIYYCEKITRSCFLGKHPDKLLQFLKEGEIDEIHLVGFDIDDCVLATAHHAQGLGFYAFVLEELSHHFEGNATLHNAGLTLLRHKQMTNNSMHPSLSYEVLDTKTS